MLSRSSWRAARVLRTARGLNEQSQPPVWKQQSSASPKLPAPCTCFGRRISSSRHALESNQLSEVKIADVKGKGREQEHIIDTAIQGSDHLSVDRREGSCTDDLESSRLQATTSSNASSSRSGKTKNIDPAQAEAWFMTALANPNSLQARETWNSYNALPLDRRKLLPLHVYSRLAKVQKTLQLKRRGSLWSRLSSIYEVWQERQAIPIAELSNTIQMLRYWFEQKEVIHSSRDFGQARRFCCHIAKLLNPYLDDDLVELEQLTDLINDYGTTSNLKEVVTILSKPLTTGRRGIETGALTTEGMRRLYTKVISRLAQRSELEQALVVTSDAWGSGILIDVQECGRNVLVALYALQTEDPDRLKKHVAILKEQSAYKDDHHPFRTWLAQIEAINEKMQLLRRNGEEPDIVGLLGSGGNEQTIALVSAKFRIRRLLSSPIRPLQNGPARHDPASVLKVLYDAIEAMKIYDQYLSHGFEADRELYRLAKMSKKRIETQSSFSSSLREAALMRLQEERDKQVRNFKKKWLPPRPITTHSQLREAKVQFPAPSSAIQADSTKHIAASSPQAAEATAADLQGATQNIYANAHVGQILHLAIELGDYDLARAVLPVAMEDSTFTWTRHDDERALAILKILLRDAGRPDITTSLRRNASQIASAFYVRWQEDLARDPKAYIEHRSGSPRHLRSPAFLLLRLLAHQQETESFEKAMQVLVQDPSIKLSAQHIRVFVAQIFKSSRCLSNIAFKLFVAKNLFSRASGYQDLKAAAESIASDPEYCRLPVQDQAFLHWCEHILHFTKQLGVTPRLSLLKDVLDMYEGHLDSEHDSLAAYIVSEMWKSGMKPAHGLQELLVRNRFRASSSALREFLKLLEEGSVTSAASRAEDTVKVLMASNLRTEALHVCELFVAASKESLTETSMEVKEAIEAMRHELQRATEAPARAPITVAAEEDLTSTVACAEMEINENRGSKSGAHVTPSVATETLPQRQGFLGEFFSDSHRATPQHEHPWARQGIAEAKEWSEAAVGFRNAVDTEEVQVPAAFVTESLSQTKKRPDVEAFFESNNNRSASLTAALPAGSASTQAFSTLAGRAGAATGPHRQESTVSILQELSQLPQQFADLTMEQVLALKRRCEIEMDAVRKKDEQILAARRGALSRADASRWQGWQEFQATPWY